MPSCGGRSTNGRSCWPESTTRRRQGRQSSIPTPSGSRGCGGRSSVAEARAVMAAMNEPAETALRVNTIRADPSSILGELRAAGDDVERPDAPPPLASPEGLVVRGRLGALARETDRGRRPGRAGAGLAGGGGGARSEARRARSGSLRRAGHQGDRDRGPNAKPGRDRRRRGRPRPGPPTARARRAAGRRLRSRVVEADAARADLGGGYDRILVDPPCSDLGALASRPDARWRKSPELIERVARIQEAILSRAAGALRPGGTLVYATCTISARENEERLAALLSNDASMRADDLGAAYPDVAARGEPRFLQTRPDRDHTERVLHRPAAPRCGARGALSRWPRKGEGRPTSAPHLSGLRRALAAPDPAAPAATAASTACGATSWSRSARTAASTRRSSA